MFNLLELFSVNEELKKLNFLKAYFVKNVCFHFLKNSLQFEFSNLFIILDLIISKLI